jgi:hypothetical protein
MFIVSSSSSLPGSRTSSTMYVVRRKAVDRRTELANEIKSQLKIYFPLALQVLDNDCSTALAADLLLQWPDLGSLQNQSAHKLRKFFSPTILNATSKPFKVAVQTTRWLHFSFIQGCE